MIISYHVCEESNEFGFGTQFMHRQVLCYTHFTSQMNHLRGKMNLDLAPNSCQGEEHGARYLTKVN